MGSGDGADKPQEIEIMATPDTHADDASWTDAASAIVEQQAREDDEASCSISLAKWDAKCRGWAMIVREGEPLPEPSEVTGASSLKQKYLRQSGSEELFGTDALLQGEENHHRKSRGWTYRLFVRNPETNEDVGLVPDEHAKSRIKAALADGRCTMPRTYLKGAGEVAAMVRILHAIRCGMKVRDFV
jgi:hypothetical protein